MATSYASDQVYFKPGGGYQLYDEGLGDFVDIPEDKIQIDQGPNGPTYSVSQETSKQLITSGNPRTSQEEQEVTASGYSTRSLNDPYMPIEQLEAEYAKRLKADEEAFAKTKAEIEAMMEQEKALISEQASAYAAAQEQIMQESQAMAQAMALEQAKIQKEIADIKAEQEAAAAKNKADIESMQRTSAQKEAASKKAGRSAGARPLLGAATPESIGQKAQMLGGEPSLSGQAGTLGAAQTLGA